MKHKQKHIKPHSLDIELGGEVTTQKATPNHGNNGSKHNNKHGNKANHGICTTSEPEIPGILNHNKGVILMKLDEWKGGDN
jgi:hypothetical protein